MGKSGFCVAHKERNSSQTMTAATRGVVTGSCWLPSTSQAVPFVCRKELLEKLSTITTLIFPLPHVLYFLV